MKHQRIKKRPRSEELEPEYELLNGYRMVKPYVYQFRTFAKERWLGRSILDVFSSEFVAYSKEYYENAILSGRVTVHDERVSCSYVIRSGDLLVHKTHRHEPPVSGEETIVVIAETKDYLVVNKPSSIPVHACGAYRFNTLHAILSHQRQHRGANDIQLHDSSEELRVLHRIDRLTSGLVIMAKNLKASQSFTSEMEHRTISKSYLARVKGSLVDFGKDAINEQYLENMNAKVQATCPSATCQWIEDQSMLLIDCPLRCLDHKDGIHECHDDGKPAKTLVQFVKTDNVTSIVLCKPITGRTHQIRLHLQLIGFPIANDPCYGGTLHYGDPKRNEIYEQAESELIPTSDQVYDVRQTLLPQQPTESENEFLQRTCKWCTSGHETAFYRPGQRCSGIWLHSFEYHIQDQRFCAGYPSWYTFMDQ